MNRFWSTVGVATVLSLEASAAVIVDNSDGAPAYVETGAWNHWNYGHGGTQRYAIGATSVPSWAPGAGDRLRAGLDMECLVHPRVLANAATGKARGYSERWGQSLSSS